MALFSDRYVTKKNEEGKRLVVTDHLSDDEYKVCQYPWPDDCFVQCGDEGIVFSPEKIRKTAFFEAFPQNTFLRGEGATVAEAEKSCWRQYQKITACSLDHANPDNFDARGYTNGYGFCKGCGMGASIIPPTNPCQSCGELTWYSQDINNNFWCEKCYDKTPRELWSVTRELFAKAEEEDDNGEDN